MDTYAVNESHLCAHLHRMGFHSVPLLVWPTYAQFMASRKIEALLKMLHFVLFERNGVQTESMAGNF